VLILLSCALWQSWRNCYKT